MNFDKISLKFVPRGSINNIPALVQILDWRRPGDKPLSEPIMVILLTHISVARPHWVLITTWLTDLGNISGASTQHTVNQVPQTVICHRHRHLKSQFVTSSSTPVFDILGGDFTPGYLSILFKQINTELAQHTPYRADSGFAASQWETALLCNDVPHWPTISLESALAIYVYTTT